MASKNTDNLENEVLVESVPEGVAEASVNGAVSPEVSDTKQPMSLEDALAAAEQAANALEEVAEPAPKRKKTKAVSDEEIAIDEAPAEDIGAAVYNPDLMMADIAVEAPDAVVEPDGDLGIVAAPTMEDVLAVDAEFGITPADVELEVAEAKKEASEIEIAAIEKAEEHPIPEVAAVMENLEETVPELQGIPKLKIPAEETAVEVAPDPIETAPVVETAPVAEVAPVVEPAPVVEAVPEKKPAPKKAPAKKSTAKPKAAEKPVEEVAPIEEAVKPSPEETAPADVKAEPEVAETAPAKNKKTDKASKKKDHAKEEKHAKEEPKSEEQIAADKEEKSKKLQKKLSPEKNFKLLKALIIILSVLVTGISGHIFYTYIYDSTTPFSWPKLIPVVPFVCQVLLALISFVALGTSKRKPIGSTIKENKQIKQEVKVKVKEAQISKEIEDNLLVPEVDLTRRRTVELSSYQIDNFYKKNIEEINGKYYMQVAKFDENVRAFEAMGATDMELCAVNMVCNSKFDEILDQPRTKTLNSKELVSYFLSKPNTFAIKKRGAIDWTFKYSSKSFGIIRENDDSYKVSIKCYPDAATKLNDAYKALEDSNFPSGPLWYCFNELRNLPPRVCKWLVDTSCQISKFQQIKTDKLKDEKTPSDYDLDMNGIVAALRGGQKYISFPKFTVVFSKGDDADLTTYLTREVEGLDSSAFTKEYYYKCSATDDTLSVLCPSKGVQEEAIIMLFDRIDEYLK